MSRTEPSYHIDPEELADYFEGILSESREGEIDEHFAECDECVLQARRYRRFAEIWQSWAAPERGEAFGRVSLLGALEQAAMRVKDSVLRERLRQWRERLPDTRAAIVDVIKEARRTALRFVTESVETLPPSGTAGDFACVPGVAGGIRTRGAARGRGAGPFRTRGRGETRPLVTVSGERGAVEVRIEQWSQGVKPLVILISSKEEVDPQVREPEEQAEALLARFEGLEAGHYLVALEPSER